MSISLDSAQSLDSTLRPPLQTIVIAWGIEIACITIGFMVAFLAGIEHAKLGRLVAFSAAAPFAAGAIVEIGRIPLVKAAFSARGRIWIALSLLMILVSATLTFNNLLWGFERAFNLRIDAVRTLAQQADEKRTAALALGEKQKQLSAQQDELQRNLADLDKNQVALTTGGVNGADSAAGDLRELIRAREQERLAMVTRQAEEMREARAVCHRAARRCVTYGVRNRQSRERAEFNRRMEELQAAILQRATAAGTQSDVVGSRIEAANAELRQVGAQLQSAGAAFRDANTAWGEANNAADAARRDSQMHRLAKFVFGRDDDDAAERMVGWLAMVSAGVLAFAGTGLAAIYYRVKTQDPAYVRAARAREERLNRAVGGLIERARRRLGVGGAAVARLLKAKLDDSVRWGQRLRKRHATVRAVKVDPIPRQPRAVPVPTVREADVEPVARVPVPPAAAKIQRLRGWPERPELIGAGGRANGGKHAAGPLRNETDRRP